MTYIVRFRGKDGAPEEISIEAASRDACIAQCRVRGIVPIGVREGSSEAPRRRKARGAQGRRILAFALMAVFAVGLGLWFTAAYRKGDDGADAVRKPVPKSAENSARSKSVPAQPAPMKGSVTNQAPAVVVDEPMTNWPHMWRGKVVASIEKCYTNMGKEIVYFTTADGRRHCSERIAYKPIFESATDDLISQAINTDPNAIMPPMPAMQGLDREFLESLKRPISINSDDPENVKRIKEAVSQAREEMKRMMDGGMTFSEVLQEHRKLANENFETRRQVAADLKQLVDAGEKDEARRYLNVMNPALEQMGLAPLEMPASHDEIMERRRANRQRMQEAAQKGAKTDGT